MEFRTYNGIGNTRHLVFENDVKSIFVWIADDTGKVLGTHTCYYQVFRDGNYVVYERKAFFCETEKCIEKYKEVLSRTQKGRDKLSLFGWN